MVSTHLTKRSLDALTPGERVSIVYDTELSGFGVRVTPAGNKSWIVEYRPGGGRKSATKRMTLAPTSTLTAQEARRKARDILAAARLGEDPAGKRRKDREAPTVREFAERYLSEEAEVKLKERSVEDYRLKLRKHVVPRIGSLKLNAVTKADITKLHRAIGRERPSTANRVVAVISCLYGYAETIGDVEEGFNPARGVKKFPERTRERFLSTEELQRLGATLRLAETDGLPWSADEQKPNAKHLPRPENRRVIFSSHTVAAIRLLLFTGCRLREILNLKWEDIDLERGLFVLPESKTGKRYVVLNGPALDVLNGLERTSTYVIAGDKHDESGENATSPQSRAKADKPRADLKRPWDRIRKHAKLDDLRLHDLRHSFASVGAAGGMGLPIVGKLLGHTQAQTTARYAHLDNDPLKRASEQIANTIASALGARDE